jgi:hypothetical protein
MMPTNSFDPVAPNVTLAECREDLMAADGDNDGKLTTVEYAAFLDAFGDRVCLERTTGMDLSTPEGQTFQSLKDLTCSTNDPCDGVTEIDITPPMSGTIAFTLCTVTYSSALNSPTCTPGTTTSPVTAAPTQTQNAGGETTAAPSAPPIQGRSWAAPRFGESTVGVSVVAAMALVWLL